MFLRRVGRAYSGDDRRYTVINMDVETHERVFLLFKDGGDCQGVIVWVPREESNLLKIFRPQGRDTGDIATILVEYTENGIDIDCGGINIPHIERAIRTRLDGQSIDEDGSPYAYGMDTNQLDSFWHHTLTPVLISEI